MSQPEFRVGHGTDVHRLVEGKPLMLGGVEVEFELGLDGHSDADVLLHAITDAVLGAAGLGDIGEWFPNTDERFKDADSGELLREAVSGVARAGWGIVNLDCTVFAERPRRREWKPQMRQSISRLLDVDEDRVNVKAKSGEKVGVVGRGEAMEAEAVVLLSRGKLD